MYILLQRDELKDIDGCLNLRKKLISYEKVKELWHNYNMFDRGSRYSQLIVQFKTIGPLEQIKEFIFDNIKTNGSHDDFCYILSQWEYLTIIANSVTPESAAAVQTFVSTVLSGQQKMTRQLEMPEHSLWVSLLENYISMKHQLGLDLRKAYKYLLRIVELIYLITGEVKGFLNKYTGNVCDPCFCFKNCTSTPLNICANSNMICKSNEKLLRTSVDENFKEKMRIQINAVDDFLKKHILKSMAPSRIRIILSNA